VLKDGYKVFVVSAWGSGAYNRDFANAFFFSNKEHDDWMVICLVQEFDVYLVLLRDLIVPD
jgi:hypothetical protein